MVQAVIRVTEKMDKGIEHYSEQWNICKAEVIEKIVCLWLEQQK